MLVAGRVLALVGGFLAIATGLGLLDFALRLPLWLRVTLWLVGMVMLGREAWRAAAPAWRFSPTLTDLALRVEKARPELRGVLASAVDFAAEADRSAGRGDQREDERIRDGLTAVVVHRALAVWKGGATRGESGVFRGRSLLRRAGWSAAAMVACAAALAASPTLWSIGAQRVLTPWAGVSWPKRTGVMDATAERVHALGMALPLRAVVTRSNRSWDATYVAVRYRLVNAAGKTGGERRELLTFQTESREGSEGSAVAGALFERLIEPVGRAVEYRFETDDDETEWQRIRLVEPPAVVSAEATITPPGYAAEAGIEKAAGGSAEERGSARLALGPGTDDRAVAPPALAGSMVELTITLNRALPIPESVRGLFMDVEEEGGDSEAEVSLAAEGASWRIRWRLAESLRLPISLRDEFGIESVEQAVYRFEAQVDRPAAATITEPASDRTALATARLMVVGEGRDDVGLAWVRVQRQVFVPAGVEGVGGGRSGPGGAMEAAAGPVVIASAEIGGGVEKAGGGGGRGGGGQGSASAEVELGDLGLHPGDEIRFTALAMDLLSASTGRDASASAPRTIRIISEAQLIGEVQGALTDIRQAAIRIEEQQAGLVERTERGIGDGASRRGQAQVSERLARQAEAIRRLVERVNENGLDDRALADLLGRSGEAASEAGRSSGRASQALDEAGRKGPGREAGAKEADGRQKPEEASAPKWGESQGAASDQGGREAAGSQGASGEGKSGEPSGAKASEGSKPSPPEGAGAPQGKGAAPGREGGAATEPEGGEEKAQGELAPEDQQAVADAQKQTQDHLKALIEMLDRGEDAWVVRNNLERLIREQKEVREKTQETGRKTAGREPEQLGAQEKSELEAIVEMQNKLAEETRQLLEEMRQREKKLSEKDPSAASGMAQASRRAESQRVEQKMRQAAGDAAQNQTASASRQQEQAQESLEEMLQDLNAGDKARDETLRRALASIIESLEGLVNQQGIELTLLDEATRERKGYAGLDARMIRLNQNTNGVFDFIKRQGAELGPVANLVGRAGEAQGSAVRDLRGLVVVSKAVRTSEDRSLDLLKQALAKAKEADEQVQKRQQEKKMQEIRKVYRRLLEEQVAIRGETEPLAAAAELTRRDRVLARGLGEREGVVRDELAALLRETKELAEATVFEFAHRRLDELTGRAAGALNEAKMAEALRSERAVEDALRSVIESLNDPPPDEEKFSNPEDEAGGGGAGGGSGEKPLIPPVKELILLKRLQGGIAQRTAELDKLGGQAPRVEIEALGRVQRDLMNVGAKFVERLQSAAGAGGAGAGVAPAPEPPADPDKDKPGEESRP